MIQGANSFRIFLNRFSQSTTTTTNNMTTESHRIFNLQHSYWITMESKLSRDAIELIVKRNEIGCVYKQTSKSLSSDMK